jgi:hypothetical protein
VLKVPVRFELGVHCQFGQTLALVGDTKELGEWSPANALRLKVSIFVLYIVPGSLFLFLLVCLFLLLWLVAF